MKKIATVFERDWAGDRSRVTEEPTPGCEWVFAGEGVATRKYDGTACMIEDGVLYKRHEVRQDKSAPAGFRQVEDDLETGKVVGWVPVGENPEDKWCREAFAQYEKWPDGTYELLGPKVQGNPEKVEHHVLFPHGKAEVLEVERTYEGLRTFLLATDVEGIVFHHPDGRMAKIKKKDFGAKR